MLNQLYNNAELNNPNQWFKGSGLNQSSNLRDNNERKNTLVTQSCVRLDGCVRLDRDLKF